MAAAGWKLTSGYFWPSLIEGPQDIWAYHPSYGSIQLGKIMGSSFYFVQEAWISPDVEMTFLRYRYRFSYPDLILGYNPEGGEMLRTTGYVSPYDRSSIFEHWGDLRPATGWKLVLGPFRGDKVVPAIIAYDPTSGELWLGEFIYNK